MEDHDQRAKVAIAEFLGWFLALVAPRFNGSPSRR
jgi:hypothetical protein